MSNFYEEKLEAFMAGMNIIKAADPSAAFQAEHDVIYIGSEKLTAEQRAAVIALKHGWYDASDVDSLGFFT